MKTTLRMLALVLAGAAVVTWLVLGANRGWTRTSVPVRTTDAVTGIEGIEYHKQFVPGLDVLGGALLVTGLLVGASFLFRNQPIEPTK